MPKWSTAILTDWAIARIKYHGITEGELTGVFEKYDIKEYSNQSGCLNFVKRWKNWEVGITARQKAVDQWIIVSAWKRQLFKG